MELLCGHTRQLLPRLPAFSMAFMDVWGTQYSEILSLLRPPRGALLVADNVLRSAAAEFLWRVSDGGYHTRLLAVEEVLRDEEESKVRPF